MKTLKVIERLNSVVLYQMRKRYGMYAYVQIHAKDIENDILFVEVSRKGGVSKKMMEGIANSISNYVGHKT